MAQEIEIEYKNLLTKEEYHLLLDSLHFPVEGTLQTNYYFDTKDFQLKEQGAALRIRKKNDNYVLTLKEPHPEGLLETHDVLTEQEAKDWLEANPTPKMHTKNQLIQLQIAVADLQYYGSLTTERREIEYENVLLVLDYSQYNKTSDFELELEAKTRSEGEQVFKSLLKKYKIQKRDTPNKIERFFLSKSN